ncbi:HLF transcription factor, PAR bZIP family member b [Engraulis encrasicolus]|uniref:HLF transcription factor, PAR bZIP family member b n=1 Tax=Engraulis encrasicolus TaxID=184585 RepID=UPI002FD61BA5
MSRPTAPMNPAAFLPTSHGVLKSLLESPVKLPQRHEGFVKEKAKAVEDEEDSAAPQSAFLGPTLWDKTATVPYDGDNFQLEYMDLEEFLSENGIPSNSAPTTATQQQQQQQQPHEHSHPNQNHQQHHNQHQQHQHHNQQQQNQQSPTTLSNHHSQSQSAGTSHSQPPTGANPNPAVQACHHNTAQTVLSCQSPESPVDPESVSVCVSFEPDPADLALSSVPGQQVFDPRRRRFSEDELKPQPMIKKARKIFIPNDLKDERYWARRRKNNMAAKRSRDARRLKENQIAIRASFLEKENSALRQEVAQLRKEVTRCHNVITRYQQQHTHSHTHTSL